MKGLKIVKGKSDVRGELAGYKCYSGISLFQSNLVLLFKRAME